MGLFSKGYEAVEVETKRQEKRREEQGKKIFKFGLQDKEENDVIFLTTKPVNFEQHILKGFSNGRETFSTYVCDKVAHGHCDLCDDGDRTLFRGAYLVYNMAEYTNQKNERYTKGLQLYIVGTRILSNLSRLEKKYGLSDRVYCISRSGTGTSTTYAIERMEEPNTMGPDEIRAILPEALKGYYDGTEESLMEIIEQQLIMELVTPLEEEHTDVVEEEDQIIGATPIPTRGATPQVARPVVTPPSAPKRPGLPKFNRP